MELDFGQEQETNRVRIVHVSAYYSNGTTLYLMNGQREVLFTNVFDVIEGSVYDVAI